MFNQCYLYELSWNKYSQIRYGIHLPDKFTRQTLTPQSAMIRPYIKYRRRYALPRKCSDYLPLILVYYIMNAWIYNALRK